MDCTRTCRSRFVTVAIVTAAVGMVLSTLAVSNAAASGGTGPSATINDWSVPERLLDNNDDGYIDYYLDCQPHAPGDTLTGTDNCRSAEIHPNSYPVRLDACASQPGDAPITRYQFSIPGASLYDGDGCGPIVYLPAQGTYEVSLTATDADGRTSTTSHAITVKDLLVVSIGDSYGSGEGVPPFIDEFAEGVNDKNSRCDRSSRAASAQAALELEKADRRTSVTFIHLACSGAQIAEGVLRPYAGANPTGNDRIPPQIDYLKALIGDRPIDLMHMSIGGNDMGFADIITSCIDPSFTVAQATAAVNPALGATLFAAWLAYPNCDVAWNDPTEVLTGLRSGGLIFQEGIAALPGRYADLNDALQTELYDAGLLGPERVYLTEYPDFTRDHNGEWCGWSATNPNSTTDLPGFTKTEFQWASEIVAPSLTAVMKSAAQSYRWNFVGGISSQYFRHGYCAGVVHIVDADGNVYPESQHWLVGLGESIADRGQPTSAFHPNIKGQNAARDRILASWTSALRNPRVPPEIKVIPTLLGFTSNLGGANGWTTGECKSWDRDDCNRDRTGYTIQIKGGHAVKGPLTDHVRMAIDGKPVTFTNGSNECQTADGDTCSVFVDNPAGPNLGGVTIVVAVDRPGIHSFDISADNVLGLTANHHYDFAVDLSPPTIDPMTVTSGTAGNNGWYVSPVGLEFTATDAPGGSGLMKIETFLMGQGTDGTPATLPTTGDAATGKVTATIGHDGNHSISSEAVDWAGLRSGDRLTRDPAGPRYDRIKIDQTAPALTISGLSDTSAAFTAAEIADGPVFTNDPAVRVHYSASDATSGVAAVRSGAVSSTDAEGSLDILAPLGLSTHVVEVEDVAGHTSTASFTVFRAVSAAKADPQGHGFWRTAVKTDRYTADEFATLLVHGNEVSRAFGAPTGRYDDVTPSSAESVLKPTSASDVELRVRRDLLTGWLNLVSGRLAGGQAVDLQTVSGWDRVVTNTAGSSRTTALNVMREVERRLVESPSDTTMQVIQSLLEGLSSNRFTV